ncbi:MAG: tetratricopeptide repeat protein [Chloroherpetonaceae bacterium]|nr:tetratricopeptide repeat protein [Chloroherpetonaceae bacterium]
MQAKTILIIIFIITSSSLFAQHKRANEESIDSLYRIGIEAIHKREFAKGVVVFNQLLQNDSTHYKALLMRGFAKQFLMDSSGAFHDYSLAIRSSEENFEAFVMRGLWASKMRNYSRANADFTAAISMKPDSAQLYFFRGLVKIEMQLFDSAIEDFSTAIGKAPLDDAYFQRAACYAQLGKNNEAEKDYEWLVENRGDLNAFRQRSAFLRRLGRYEESLGDIEKALQLGPSIPELLYEAGTLKLGMGLKEKGLNDLARAYRMGYGPAKELILKNYSKEFISDSLRVYYAPEIVVQSLAPEQLVALKELKQLSFSAPRIIRSDMTALRSGRANDLFNTAIYKAAKVGGISMFGCNENVLLAGGTSQSSQGQNFATDGGRGPLRNVSIQCIVILLNRKARQLNDPYIMKLAEEMSYLVDQINNQMQIAESQNNTVDDARRTSESALIEIEAKIKQMSEYLAVKNYEQ